MNNVALTYQIINLELPGLSLNCVYLYGCSFVTEPPKWNIEPKGQLNVTGADVVIRCSAYGNPVPTVSWMVNGRPLSGMILRFKPCRQDVFLMNSILSMQLCSHYDSGLG